VYPRLCFKFVRAHTSRTYGDKTKKMNFRHWAGAFGRYILCARCADPEIPAYSSLSLPFPFGSFLPSNLLPATGCSWSSTRTSPNASAATS
jgi:hypothetical protein